MYLAKSANHSPTNQPESLADHTNLVVTNSRVLSVKFPHLAKIIEAAATIHDFGKAEPVFQAMLTGGPKSAVRHEVYSLAFIDWLSGFSQDELDLIAAIVLTHHRDAIPTKASLSNLTSIEQVDIGYLHSLGNGYFKTRKRVLKCQIVSERIMAHIRGFKARNPTLDDILGRGLLMTADWSASAHVFQPKQCRPRSTMPFNLYPHQQQSKRAGHVLLLAPTGSGKTESAELWYSQQPAGKLFYLLPYQASMNAMRVRLGQIYGFDSVGLAHGRSLLAEYRIQQSEQNLTSQQAEQKARVAKAVTRLHQQQITVASPYQLLKNFYRLSGYEMALCDYHGSSFIYDEIHAYEPKRLALFIATIDYLANQLQANFFLMSATFPKIIRQQLAKVLPGLTTIQADQATYHQFQRHRINVLHGDMFDSANLNQIIKATNSGQSVLVVCNLVRRAKEMKTILQAVHPGRKIDLLHGRFNMADRSQIEARIRNMQPGTILVATQAVEVSLDLDFDTIFTDPANLEALIQRFGRVNRRNLKNLADVHIFDTQQGFQLYDSAMVQAGIKILKNHHLQAIDESMINQWLDQIYTGQIEKKWLAEFNQSLTSFQAVMDQMRAYNTADLATFQAFYQAFDGVEVLPRSLEQQFNQMTGIEKYELLVPVHWYQLQKVLDSGQAVKVNDQYVVDVNYSNSLGLEI